MLNGEAADIRLWVADAAKFILLGLEDVGVNRADADADICGVLFQRAPVVCLIPGNVECDGGRDAGEAVNCGCVFQTFGGIAGCSGLFKHAESGAGIPVTPRWRFNVLLFERRFDCVNIDSLSG